MITLVRLMGHYAKMDLLWFLRDTRYCLLQIVSDSICAVCTMAGVFLLSARFHGLGGMSGDQVLFLMGYATLVEGVYFLFFMGNNIGMISRIIGRGQLDHCRIQPVPLWVTLAAEGFAPFSSSSMLIAGILLTGYSVGRLGLSVTPMWLFLLVLSVCCSTLIMLSVIYILSCAAFYAPAAAEEIAQIGRDLFTTLKTFPLGTINRTAKTVLITVLPVGLGAWFPSASLCGEASKMIPAFCFLLAVTTVFTTIALTLFKKGLKHYETYGSPRYSGFGHR